MTYDKFKTLVKYVTEVGPADDKKRSYKYPLSACELLSSDSSLPSEFFFTESPITIREKVEEPPAAAPEDQEAEEKKPEG